MISVAEALEHVLALVEPGGTETVPLKDAGGRVMREDASATRNQPPFPASAMDGYAVQGTEVKPGADFTVIGEAAAGRGFAGSVGPGQAVRIFTGAPVPDGADRIVIQEDATRSGDVITLRSDLDQAAYVRPAGADFEAGFTLPAPLRLGPPELALLAAMNVPAPVCAKKPVIAIIATGDELVMPGEDPSADQIIASNIFGLKAMFEAEGAHVRLMPIARDTITSLDSALRLARDADLIVTIGGASEGDHDLVAKAAEGRGLQRSFYKIAMRPGKPLMAGRIGASAMIGLPGNPVSAMVCGTVFVLPMIRKMLGLADILPAPGTAPLAEPVKANGPRAHYMRAARLPDGSIRAFTRQDSALLTVLARADALLIRPPHDPERAAGHLVEWLPL